MRAAATPAVTVAMPATSANHVDTLAGTVAPMVAPPGPSSGYRAAHTVTYHTVRRALAGLQELRSDDEGNARPSYGVWVWAAEAEPRACMGGRAERRKGVV